MTKALHAVAPMDGSAEAEKIFPALVAIGAKKVTLLHVKVPGDREGELAGAADRARKAGLEKVESLTTDGTPADAIAETAERLGASLIALTTHGKGGSDRRVLGSVAEVVIRVSATPVLMIRGGDIPTPPSLLDRVLIPLDGSDHAWRAVEVLASLADPSAVKLTLAAAVECLGPARRLGPAKPDDNVETRYFRLQDESARKTLTASADRARSLGFEVGIDVALGSPAAKILDLADASKATMIALTTRGRSGLSRLLFGSVAEQIVRASTKPLLICRVDG